VASPGPSLRTPPAPSGWRASTPAPSWSRWTSSPPPTARPSLNVELKNPGSFAVHPGTKLDADELAGQADLWRPFVERVLDELAGEDVLVSSFCEAALAVASEVGDHPTAVICNGTVEAAVAVARQHDCAALHPSLEDLFDDEDPRPRRARPAGYRGARTDAPERPTSRDRALDAAAAHGWTVNAWTVTRWHEAARLHRMGVDGVIADHPTVTLSVG
jgi:glycerophosphoryl diester phosphodiesterase